MITAHIKKLRLRTDITAEEENAIRGAVTGTRPLPADEVFVRAGEDLTSTAILVSGWMARSKDLPSGERQVTALHVPGDMVDLHGFTLKRLDHDIMTLSDSVVAIVPHEQLAAITTSFPHLARVYWFQSNVEAAIHREWELSLGQRSAIARMANLFCELYARLRVVGRTNGSGYDFPLTQREVSECLGLTVVHANRTLQELRRRGLVEVENRFVRILDRRGLEGLAQFDPCYLYLERHLV